MPYKRDEVTQALQRDEDWSVSFDDQERKKSQARPEGRAWLEVLPGSGGNDVDDAAAALHTELDGTVDPGEQDFGVLTDFVMIVTNDPLRPMRRLRVTAIIEE